MTLEVTGRGRSWREAFVDAAAAVLALTVDPSEVNEAEVREVRAHGVSAAALLASWIDECLYVHEVEGFACRRVELPVFEMQPSAGGEPLRLHSLLHGEPLDPARHRILRRISGVTPARVSMNASADAHEITLTVGAECL